MDLKFCGPIAVHFYSVRSSLLPKTSSLRRSRVTFGDLATVLISILLAEEQDVPEDLKSKMYLRT